MYRMPFIAISTIFFPLWVMGFIMVSIFFMSYDQPQSIDARVTFAATVYVSFAAYFQVIRGALPKSSNLSIMEILVYAIIGICVLGVVRSLSKNEDLQADPWGDPLFWVSIFFFSVSLVVILGGFLVHKLCMEPKYRRDPSDNEIKTSNKILF